MNKPIPAIGFGAGLQSEIFIPVNLYAGFYTKRLVASCDVFQEFKDRIALGAHISLGRQYENNAINPVVCTGPYLSLFFPLKNFNALAVTAKPLAVFPFRQPTETSFNFFLGLGYTFSFFNLLH